MIGIRLPQRYWILRMEVKQKLEVFPDLVAASTNSRWKIVLLVIGPECDADLGSLTMEAH
ncbi:MAG: hypothetical protein ACREQA_06295 [Candidatus Binatia bacterium]